MRYIRYFRTLVARVRFADAPFEAFTMNRDQMKTRWEVTIFPEVTDKLAQNNVVLGTP